MKQSLLEKVGIFLLKEGYTIKSLTRTCFDIVARKENHILLIKVLENANSVSKLYAEEMEKISGYIKASPLIIAEEAGEKLHDNIIYSRFGIFTLNFNTLRSCINHQYPILKRDHAGLAASLIGQKLKEAREQEGFSLADISKKIGVTKRMIQRYESGLSEITLKKALKIYDLFGHDVFNKINIFDIERNIIKDYKTDISKKYNELGFEALEMKKVPFNIIAKKEKEIILTEVGDQVNPNSQSFSKLIDADNLVIFKKKKPKKIPAITKKEFLDFEKAEKLIKFVKEFS